MQRLPTTHPWLSNEIQTQGSWTVQRSDYPFSSLAADQTIEQTINRDSKTSGGIRGITLTAGMFETVL